MTRLISTLCLFLPLAVAKEPMYPFSIDQDHLGGAADFSFLNHPLGPAARLFVKGNHFFTLGEDGKPGTADDQRTRLFGVNLAFGANFPEEKDAPRIARRLRRLGINLVRLHHMDSSPDRDPNNAGSILTNGAYPSLNPVSIARLRAFLNALKAEGIYVNLNLHVGYEFRPAVDHVPAMPEGVAFPKQSKPLHIFYPRMVELQCQYVQAVLEKLGLRGDPVLALVEIDNETSLLQAWQTGGLQKALVGEYKAEFDRQFAEFGGKDLALFLADRDRAYLRRMLAAVRGATDDLVPVTGTQMGYGGLLNLDSQADMSYQDNHFYVDHYNFPHRQWDAHDWRIRDQSSAGSGLSQFLNMAFSREAGKPFTVSEFNEPWPNTHGAEIDPTLAAFAAFQDWDGLMHFAYAHSHNWEQTGPNGFNLNGDWTKYANFGQAAWLFRTGAVESGRQVIDIPISQELRLQAAREKVNGRFSTFLSKTFDLAPEVALVHPVRLKKDGTGKLPPCPVQEPYVSDTKQITYGEKLFKIQADQVAAVIGFVSPGGTATADALTVELAPTARGFVSLLLTALDSQPIRHSAKLLLSTPGYTLRTGQDLVHYGEAKDWWTLAPEGTSGPSGNRDVGAGPILMEKVESFVTLATAAKRMEVYPLDGAGSRMAPVKAMKTKGGFRIHLASDSPWYEIVQGF